MKLQITDPTYIRTIYDGLVSGSLHKDNTSALPAGLVGIYEEALPPESNVDKRKKFLEFFAVWALLKKEVSAAFVSQLLGWTEKRVLDYIALYSKWFNAPLTGKYVLYHERFRSFVLQKISHAQFATYNEAIINLGKRALEMHNGDKWEQYALEHLSTHLLIKAMESKDATALKTLAYSTIHWNRQVEISNGFEWSKRMLNDMMLWASKYDDDEVIECALNKVDLHHQEQNDAPRIVGLVVQSEIDIALQRIEAFGWNDKEGLRRKFILYMLSLMELTFNSDMDLPKQKKKIGKILRHFDDNMPVDDYILDWNDFFPSYLIFEMTCKWAELGLDYLIVYKRSTTRYSFRQFYGNAGDGWEMDWINLIGFIDPNQFEVLLSSSRGINNHWSKRNALKEIANRLYENGQKEESVLVTSELLTLSKSLDDESDVESILKDIAIIWTRQGLLNDALNIVNKITDETIKDEVYSDMAFEISKQGDKSGSISIVQKIIDESEKIRALKRIAIDLGKQGKIEESLEIARGLNSEFHKCHAIMEISKLVDTDKSVTILKESLDIATDTNDAGLFDSILVDIAIEYVKHSLYEESLQISGSITNEREKGLALFGIAFQLSKQNKKEESSGIFQESVEIINGIENISEKDSGLKEIAIELSRQGRIEESLDIVDIISDQNDLNSAFREIAVELVKQGKLAESIDIARRSSDKESLNNTFKDILIELSGKKQYEALAVVLFESIISARGTDNENQRSNILKDIVSDCIKNGQRNRSLEIAGSITVEQIRFDALGIIAVELTKQNNLKDSLSIVSSIGDSLAENNTLANISIELSKLGKVEESIAIAREINDVNGKLNVSVELFKQGYLEESELLIQESLVIAETIDEDWDMSLALMQIAVTLCAQGKLEESLNIVNTITDDYWELEAFNSIAVELAKLGRIQESLEIVERLDDEGDEFAALRDISIELSKIGLLKESLNITNRIMDERNKARALKGIALALSLRDDWELSEEIGNGIPLKSEKIACWVEIGMKNCSNRGYSNSIKQFGQFKSKESSYYYRKGVVNQINSSILDQNVLLDVLRDNRNDIFSLKYLLEIHAIKQIFVQKLEEEQFQRLDKTFDLKWVIDINNSSSTSI